MNTNTNTPDTLLDLNSMMEETLDQIPDAPDYMTPPAGEYQLTCTDAVVEKYKAKAKGNVPAHDAQRLRITYAIAATYSVAANEAPCADGTLFTETFQGTVQGVGFFKARIKAIMQASDLAGVSLGDMMNSVKGITFDAKITIKKSPNPSGGEYENVNIRVVPPADAIQ